MEEQELPEYLMELKRKHRIDVIEALANPHLHNFVSVLGDDNSLITRLSHLNNHICDAYRERRLLYEFAKKC